MYASMLKEMQKPNASQEKSKMSHVLIVACRVQIRVNRLLFTYLGLAGLVQPDGVSAPAVVLEKAYE
jgi:hypothetical protein